MISVDEARALVLNAITPLSSENAPLIESAGRALAKDLTALRDLPGYDNSAMDGVGVRSDDVKSVPTTLKLVGASLPGGDAPPYVLAPGEAMRIMTGGLVPPGVDAVVMRESTDESRVLQNEIIIKDAPTMGQHIRRRGEDVRAGTPIVRAGDVITPARLNLLLASGHVNADVIRRPVVAVLASGDELREIGVPAGDTDVINSNSHAIAAAARLMGCEVRALGIARDSLESHVEKILESDGADVLLTIGGVSMGTHDFVRPALEQTGCTLDMWRVAMRPGKPIAFGRRGEQRVFGLPGNPVSAMVSFELFVRPALKKMMGLAQHDLAFVRAALAEPFKKKPGLEHFARAKCENDVVTVLDKQGSHQISGLAEANALARFPKDSELTNSGDMVDVLML
jgi:molybdopterin molybdotransferase